MTRVPLPIVVLLGLAVFGGVLWHGMRRHDFTSPPTATELEQVRAEVARELARPSGLFALDEDGLAAASAPLAPATQPAPAPEPEAPPPVLDAGDLERDLELDAWAKEDAPAASFIELASRLESDAELAWALLAWERVLDRGQPDLEESRAAVNGIRRLRASLGDLVRSEAKPSSLLLRIDAPADRLTLTRRAAKTVADFVEIASSGLLVIEPALQRSREKSETPRLKVSFGPDATTDRPSIQVAAPDNAEGLEDALLQAVFKLVAADLALRSSLSPVPSPPAGEFPAESLEFRITRLAWREFAGAVTK